jgi:hypothetical protein
MLVSRNLGTGLVYSQVSQSIFPCLTNRVIPRSTSLWAGPPNTSVLRLDTLFRRHNL